jgi:hypothetical protein
MLRVTSERLLRADMYERGLEVGGFRRGRVEANEAEARLQGWVFYFWDGHATQQQLHNATIARQV